MNDLQLDLVSEIVIIAIEAVIFFPFAVIDYRITRKIVCLGFSDKNPMKYPVAIAAMFACGLIVWCILGAGFDFAVFDNDIDAALVVVSALLTFGMALPICDFMRYKKLKNKRR